MSENDALYLAEESVARSGAESRRDRQSVQRKQGVGYSRRYRRFATDRETIREDRP